VSLSLEGLIKLDHVGVAHVEQERNFVHNFELLLLFAQEFLVYRLQSHELAGELVHAQIDLAESSSA